jgi:hypothetical protein
VPTLGLCGRENGCIGADVFRAAMMPEDFPAGLACHPFQGAGYFVHRQAPELVNQLILGWLATHRCTARSQRILSNKCGPTLVVMISAQNVL